MCTAITDSCTVLLFGAQKMLRSGIVPLIPQRIAVIRGMILVSCSVGLLICAQKIILFFVFQITDGKLFQAQYLHITSAPILFTILPPGWARLKKQMAGFLTTTCGKVTMCQIG